MPDHDWSITEGVDELEARNGLSLVRIYRTPPGWVIEAYQGGAWAGRLTLVGHDVHTDARAVWTHVKRIANILAR